MDGRIMRCGIISSCQSAATSKTRGHVRAEPSLQLGLCAYAAENQRVGKTRRRSIYSADRRQPDASEPK